MTETRSDHKTLARIIVGFLALLVDIPCHARGPYYSFRDLLAASEVAGFGSVTDVQSERLRLTFSEFIKGSNPGKDITVDLPPISPFDGGYAAYKKGDNVVVFLVREEGKYALALGDQSIVVVAAGEQASYREALQHLSKYEISKTTAARTELLKQMLKARRISKTEALRILTLDPDTDSNAALAKEVLLLTRDPDPGIASPATDVLGRIATKDEISALADLAASSNKHVRQIARIALKNRTGHEVAGNDEDPEAKRKEAIRAWKNWWTENKDKVHLRRQ